MEKIGDIYEIQRVRKINKSQGDAQKTICTAHAIANEKNKPSNHFWIIPSFA